MKKPYRIRPIFRLAPGSFFTGILMNNFSLDESQGQKRFTIDRPNEISIYIPIFLPWFSTERKIIPKILVKNERGADRKIDLEKPAY